MRLPDGGRIDRTNPLRFEFDGRKLEGYAGDTLASALLANGVRLVARSFKYHRPRGVFTAGAEEPNALVQLGTGGRSEPNLRATQIELYDGLAAASQNRWPSLGFDLGAFNGRIAPLIPAGFYYKTFKWPRRFWPRYEHVIRRMAGMGRAPEAPDPDRYEKRNLHCDILVVGGGPAGLAAALVAGRAGARTLLVDEQNEFGGALLDRHETIDGAPALDWVATALMELSAMPDVRLLPRASVFGYYDHNFLGILERASDHLGPGAPGPRQRLWRVRAREVVLATGAVERPVPFAQNDLPGVMLASAAQAYVNRYAVRPGRRAIVFTTNDSAYGAALDLEAGGVEIAAIVDARPAPAGPLVTRAREAGLEILSGRVVARALGRRRVRGAELKVLDESGTRLIGSARKIGCDLIAVSGGWSPNVQLFAQSPGHLRYDDSRGCLLPGRAAQQERSAGAANGAFALVDCLYQGAQAGAEAAELLGFRLPAGAATPPRAERLEEGPMRLLWSVPWRDEDGGGGHRVFVDLQNDVTAADLALAAREGYVSVEHLKRYTTLGMGTDQGKTANLNGIAILAQELGADIAAIGTTTFRPPYTPVGFGAIAGRQVGEAFDPLRRTPMDHWQEAAGAQFERFGQWRRAAFYPRPGEDKAAAVARESLAVRQRVGLLDASTLGKLDIQGPDAVRLLDMLYTNDWSDLEIGRARYGIMLGEDGMVMDDGVGTRLGPSHFLLTTTTGNAGRVQEWVEEWLQCEFLDYRVYCTSVTEHWASVCVAGPFARRLLAELTQDIDLAPESFPHMSVRSGHVAGFPARVFRVSFTGELSYEINVPARHGIGLWTACLNAGEPYGIVPFGTEALELLRAEKGYIAVGHETDGTVMPQDLGLGWLVSKRKADFIGKRSLARPDAVRTERKQLVGLLTEERDRLLPEGAQIVAALKRRPPMPMIGHVTSSYRSPTLGRTIALALLQNGRARHGDRVRLPLLDGRAAEAEICDPRFYDREGRRLHG
jgi:sarcosine oxidase subunit alpha